MIPITRTSDNYSPIILPFYIYLMDFRRQKEAITFNFSTWISKSKFETNQRAFAPLSSEFEITGTALTAFLEENKDVIEMVDSKIEQVIDLDKTKYTVDNYCVNGWERVITVNSKPKQGTILETKTISDFQEGFDQAMQSNKQMLQAVGMICLINASKRSEFFAEVLATVQELQAQQQTPPVEESEAEEENTQELGE